MRAVSVLRAHLYGGCVGGVVLEAEVARDDVYLPTVHRYCIHALPVSAGASGSGRGFGGPFSGRGALAPSEHRLTGQKSLGFSLFQVRGRSEQVIPLPKFPEAINFAMIWAKAFPISLHCRRGAPGGPIVS